MDPLVLLLATLFFTLLGVATGLGTGLVPGIHVNNVALLVYVGQGTLAGVVGFLFWWASPSAGDIALLLSSLIIATSVSHTFISFVPSVFLGAPNEDNVLSILPGHRMLLRGKGCEAVILCARGCLWGFVSSLALILPLRMLMGSPVSAYEKLRPVMAGLLALVVTLVIYSEEKRQVSTGRMRVKAHEIGGLQLLDHPDRMSDESSWPELEAGQDATFEGAVAKVWHGGFLLVRGEQRIVVQGDGEDFKDAWVRVQGIVLPETRIASASEQRNWALLLFLLSGALGWVLLSTPGIEAANWFPVPALANSSPSMMLFPLFTGLFGLSTMILSGASRESLPEQETGPAGTLELWRERRAVVSGTVAGAAVSWFPGVSGASATVISRYLAGGEPEGQEESENDREFLLSIGAANAASTVFTLVALFVILKGRSGASATIGALLSSSMLPWEPLSSLPVALALLLFSSLVAAILAFLLAARVARIFAERCGRIRYGLLIRIVTGFLLVSMFLLSGALGLVVGGAATAMGLLPPIMGVRRIHLMGSLILPAIVLLAL